MPRPNKEYKGCIYTIIIISQICTDKDIENCTRSAYNGFDIINISFVLYILNFVPKGHATAIFQPGRDFIIAFFLIFMPSKTFILEIWH